MPLALKLDPSERFFICGATGSGKTYFASHMLRQWRRANWRVVIVDPKHYWMEDHPDWERRGPGTVDKPRLVERFDRRLAVQCYQPSIPAWRDPKLDQLCDDILAEGRVVVYFDEIAGVADANRIAPSFGRLWTQGRAKKVAAWSGSQRPLRIPEDLKSQAEGWAAFLLRKRKDRLEVADYTDSPAIATTKLPKRWFWLYHVGMDGPAQLMRPLEIGKSAAR